MSPPRNVEVTPHTVDWRVAGAPGRVLTLDNLGSRTGPCYTVLAAHPDAGRYCLRRGGRGRPRVGDRVGVALVGTTFLLRNLQISHFDLTDFLPPPWSPSGSR